MNSEEYHEFMAEFIPINEFTYEIMVEFINLELIWIQLHICFSEGTIFTHPK